MQLTTHVGTTEGLATLDVRSFPFMVGNSSDNLSLECPCGKSLGTGLYSGQILNLLIRCGQCSRLLDSPFRAEGQPIAGRPVYVPPGGTYLLGGVLNVADRPVMMVGHDALFGYARETGRRIPDVYDPGHIPVPTNLDAESLQKVADELRSLLGEQYQRLEDADARGRASRTPPSGRHRLIELIEFARTTADGMRDWDGQSEIILDGNLLAESFTVLAVAFRWKNHPAWPALKATLASESEGPHTVMMLTAASYLVDANNGVGLHTTTARQNLTTADIWIEPDLSERIDLEVKTPLAFRGPRCPISEPHAISVLERALKKSSRQRRNTRSSLLIVGGFHMGTSYDTVVSTAKAMLALERRKWRGLAGIMIVDCTYEEDQSSNGQATQFAAAARFEIAKHPGYLGKLSIRTDTNPTSAPPGVVRPS